MPLYATFTFSETGKNASTDYRKCEIHHFRLLCSFPRFGNGEKCVYKTAPKLRGYHYGSSSQAINSWLIINTIHNRDAVPSQWPSLEEGGRVWGTGEDDEGGQGEVRCLHSDRRRSTHLVPLLPAAPGNDFMDHCKYSSLLSNIKPTRLFFNWADRQALHMRIDWKQFYSQTLLDPYPSRYPGLVSMRPMPFGIPGYAKN